MQLVKTGHEVHAPNQSHIFPQLWRSAIRARHYALVEIDYIYLMVCLVKNDTDFNDTLRINV